MTGNGLDRARYLDLLDARVRVPGRLPGALRGRARRDLVGEDGRLLVVAADHTARGKLTVGGDPLAAADRFTLLDRLVRLLADPGVDGVLGTADVLEDLAWLGALEGRLAIGAMNRGGIAGARWELDDRMTAYDAEHVASAGLDGGKVLLRLDDDDPGVPRTLEAVAAAVTGLSDRGLAAVVEVLPYSKDGTGRAVLDRSHERAVQAVAVASGLGASSAHTWLKIPPSDRIAEVAAATSLPILLLGGDPAEHGDPAAGTAALTRAWEVALREPNVRGLIPGRSLLYPHDGNVESALRRAVRLVHPTWTDQ